MKCREGKTPCAECHGEGWVWFAFDGVEPKYSGTTKTRCKVCKGTGERVPCDDVPDGVEWVQTYGTPMPLD